MGFLNNNETVVVGFELRNDYSQISYSLSESGNVESLSQVAGAEDYNIPTVLCKRIGVNQWFYGRDALKYAGEQKGILVDHLLEAALDGEPVIIDGESFDPIALMTLFVKRCLGMLSPIVSFEKIGALMITCEQIDSKMLNVLERVVAGLRMKTDKIVFQSNMESYYSYMIKQPTELWMPQSVLFDYNDNSITMYRMECNRKTSPVVAFIEERNFPFRKWEPAAENDFLAEQENREFDSAFLSIAEETCSNRVIGSVFLLGDGFNQQWMKDSLKFLCRNRRVFMGNNLFCKGACLGMKERIYNEELNKEYVFLGNDKLKANIGCKVLRRGEESYFALLDAGLNWYEAERELELYLQDGQELDFQITPLVGKEKRTVRMQLDELSDTLSRIYIHLSLESERVMLVTVEDLGLGTIRPSSGKVWKDRIELY